VGHELYYQSDNQHIGSISIRRWEESRKLLPLLLDFANRAMQKDWGSGIARDVAVFAGGVSVPQLPPPEEMPPAAEPLSLDRLLSEDWLDLNEIYFYECAEWDRLFAWCDFLARRDGAFGLYRPLVETLRPYLSGVSMKG